MNPLLLTLFSVVLLSAVWRPVWPAAIFLALIAPTSSLPWQLGYSNLSLPVLFLAALGLGLSLRLVADRLRGRHDRWEHPGLRVAAIAAIVTVIVTTLLSLASHTAAGALPVLASQELGSRIWRFNPAGVVGRLQAALILGAAPLLVLAGAKIRGGRILLGSALVGGGVLVVAPLVQMICFGDTSLRPDRQSWDMPGWVGFLQDPHAYAAALLLVAACSVGVARALVRAGHRQWAGLLVLLATAATANLVLTGSRAGLVSLLVGVPVFVAATAAPMTGNRRRRRLLVAGGLLIVVSLAVGFALASAFLYPSGPASGIAARPGEAPGAAYTLRLREVTWRKALILMGDHPLYGVGPGGFPTALVEMDNPAPETVPRGEFLRHLTENAHSYFLQVGAETGIPGLVAHIALYAAALLALWRWIARARPGWVSGFAQGLMAGQVALLTLSMASHPLLLAEIEGSYWLLFVGVVLADRRRSIETDGTGVVGWIDRTFYPDHGQNWDDTRLRRLVMEGLPEGARILDLGAGRGRLPQLDFRGDARRVVGLDPDPEIRSNRRVDARVRGEAGRLPFASETFDMVVSANMLEHVPEPSPTFEEVARVLRPGGRYVLKTPNRLHYVPLLAALIPNRFHERIHRWRGRDEADTFKAHYRANTRARLREYSSRAGLEVERIRLLEGRPEYLRMAFLPYLLGISYERIVNATERLARFRAVLIATLRRPETR